VTRDEFLDAVVEKCVAVRVGGHGVCRTHSVEWGPDDFKNGRCWKAIEIISFIDIAEPLIREQVAREIHDNV